MEIIPKHWPTPTSAEAPSPVLNQTLDAFFAWTYVASFAAWLPFWAATLAVMEPGPGALPAPIAQPLSLLTGGRAK